MSDNSLFTRNDTFLFLFGMALNGASQHAATQTEGEIVTRAMSIARLASVAYFAHTANPQPEPLTAVQAAQSVLRGQPQNPTTPQNPIVQRPQIIQRQTQQSPLQIVDNNPGGPNGQG